MPSVKSDGRVSWINEQGNPVIAEIQDHVIVNPVAQLSDVCDECREFQAGGVPSRPTTPEAGTDSSASLPTPEKSESSTDTDSPSPAPGAVSHSEAGQPTSGTASSTDGDGPDRSTPLTEQDVEPVEVLAPASSPETS